MSLEGVTLIARIVVVALLIVAAAIVRVLVGPNRKRGLYMGAGALGGLSAGIAVASLISPWMMRDVSVVCACLGIVAGWGVAWPFARQVPDAL
jgi:MFS family permease